MTEDQLRALVRDAVARHLGQPQASGPGTSGSGASAASALLRAHPSHQRYVVLQRGGEDGNAGPCLIEPAVTCNHCGYCQSHGH